MKFMKFPRVQSIPFLLLETKKKKKIKLQIQTYKLLYIYKYCIYSVWFLY